MVTIHKREKKLLAFENSSWKNDFWSNISRLVEFLLIPRKFRPGSKWRTVRSTYNFQKLITFFHVYNFCSIFRQSKVDPLNRNYKREHRPHCSPIFHNRTLENHKSARWSHVGRSIVRNTPEIQIREISRSKMVGNKKIGEQWEANQKIGS